MSFPRDRAWRGTGESRLHPSREPVAVGYITRRRVPRDVAGRPGPAWGQWAVSADPARSLEVARAPPAPASDSPLFPASFGLLLPRDPSLPQTPLYPLPLSSFPDPASIWPLPLLSPTLRVLTKTLKRPASRLPSLTHRGPLSRFPKTTRFLAHLPRGSPCLPPSTISVFPNPSPPPSKAFSRP